MNALVTVQHYPVTDLERMARAFAVSKLFGVQNPEQALALCLVAQAEGRHPATAAQDYSIIQGRPSKKADAMLRDFLASGGKVEWHQLDNTKADATFSHPAGGKVRIDWTLERAKAAGLAGNAMYSKYPRQMLRARTVSEGVRTVCPGATSGMYVPEEVQDFAEEPRHVEVRDVTTRPPRAEPQRALEAPVVESPPADRPVDRSADVVPPPDGHDTGDWEAWRKVIAKKISRAQSEAQVDAIQIAHAAAITACAKLLPDTMEKLAGFVSTKKAQLAKIAAVAAEAEDAEAERFTADVQEHFPGAEVVGA